MRTHKSQSFFGITNQKSLLYLCLELEITIVHLKLNRFHEACGSSPLFAFSPSSSPIFFQNSESPHPSPSDLTFLSRSIFVSQHFNLLNIFIPNI